MSRIVSEIEVVREKVNERPTVVRNATDLQRLKVEKLMKNPDKVMVFPEKPKERGMPVVPEFVRNVMGSSAGAGSGEFHVYRHLRRKEYARQKFMKERGERDRLEDEYHQKLEDNKRKAEEKTAKKRAKRLKRKGKTISKKKANDKKGNSSDNEENCNSESSSEEENLDTEEISLTVKEDVIGANEGNTDVLVGEDNQIINEDSPTTTADEQNEDNT